MGGHQQYRPPGMATARDPMAPPRWWSVVASRPPQSTDAGEAGCQVPRAATTTAPARPSAAPRGPHGWGIAVESRTRGAARAPAAGARPAPARPLASWPTDCHCPPAPARAGGSAGRRRAVLSTPLEPPGSWSGRRHRCSAAPRETRRPAGRPWSLGASELLPSRGSPPGRPGCAALLDEAAAPSRFRAWSWTMTACACPSRETARPPAVLRSAHHAARVSEATRRAPRGHRRLATASRHRTRDIHVRQ